MNIPVDVGLYVNAIGEIDEMNMVSGTTFT